MMMMQRKPWLIAAFAAALFMGGMLLLFSS
jgi:hypothetical protein